MAASESTVAAPRDRRALPRANCQAQIFIAQQNVCSTNPHLQHGAPGPSSEWVWSRSTDKEEEDHPSGREATRRAPVRGEDGEVSSLLCGCSIAISRARSVRARLCSHLFFEGCVLTLSTRTNGAVRQMGLQQSSRRKEVRPSGNLQGGGWQAAAACFF